MNASTQGNCPVCLNPGARERSISKVDAYHVDCPRCGNFDITRIALINLASPSSDAHRWKLSAYIRTYALDMLDSTQLDRISHIKPPSLEQRAALLLRKIHREFPPGTSFSLLAADASAPDDIADPAWISTGWCRNGGELNFIFNDVLFKELHWLDQDVRQYGQPPSWQITAKGILRLENGSPTEASQKGFCAMWFNSAMLPLWQEVIHPAMANCGYDPVRLDLKDYNGSIDDEIIAEIRSARFLVADLTGHRGGVYYEAGFAHGLGLPVIFMHQDLENPDIHFDLRQYNFILWKPEQPEEARKKLENRILATLGRGPLRQD